MASGPGAIAAPLTFPGKCDSNVDHPWIVLRAPPSILARSLLFNNADQP